MRERIKFIDQLKGVAIFLVVVGHLIQYNVVEGTDNKVFDFIYSFHMPLFMFLSGYIAFHTIKIKVFEKYGTFLAKKSRTLLIPFFSWPLLVDGVFFKKGLDFDILGQTQKLFYDPRTGLWFLWYLFFLTVIYSLFVGISDRLTKKSFIYDLFLCFILLIIVGSLRLAHITYIDSFLQYYFYFFVGVFFSKYLWIQKIISNRNVSSLLIISFLSVVGYYSFKESHSDPMNMLVKIICAITATFTFYNIAKEIAWSDALDKFVSGMGTSSLAIYVTHSNFVRVIPDSPLLPDISLTMLIILSFPIALLIIILCKLIHKIIMLFPILDFLLYGGRLEIKSDKS